MTSQARKLEEKLVDMDLIKPQTVKVATALERELARLHGYQDAEPQVDIV